MRITGGKSRGVRLQTPSGRLIRPAADALREALFSSLGVGVVGSRFADLFAGCGAYGLDAWSRGAAGGTLVENNILCSRCARENVARVAKSGGFDVGAVVLERSDVFKWRGYDEQAFDLVFADPPYELLTAVERDLFRLAGRLLKEDGILVLEKPANLILEPAGWRLCKELGKKRGRGPSLALWKPSGLADSGSEYGNRGDTGGVGPEDS